MTAFTFLAQTGDLCQALAAVAPFANDKMTGTPFAHVRLFVDDTNIHVGATNGNALGLALAASFSLSAANADGEPLDQGLFEVDLLPGQCRSIVALFKDGAGKPDEDEPGAELRVEVTDDEVTITDASGLLEGQSLTLPRPPTADNAAAAIVSVEERNATGALPDPDLPPRYYAPSLALVIKAAKIYGHHLTFEHKAPQDESRSGSTLVRVGESFLAVLVDAWLGDEREIADQKQWVEAWTARLGRLRPAALAVTTNDVKE